MNVSPRSSADQDASEQRPRNGVPHILEDQGGSQESRRRGVPRSDSARSEWERHARWWQENFTEGADVEYARQIIPMLLEHLAGPAAEGIGSLGTPTCSERFPGDAVPTVLDVGAGEGQIGRAVASRTGWPVVGVEAAWAQVQRAHDLGGGPAHLRGDAALLPVRDASVDAAIACLLLEHVADMESALGEIARVLRPRGCLLVVVNHPIVSTPGSGWVDDHTVQPPEQYWQLGPYLADTTVRERVADGVELTFHHRRLSRYLNGARERGLALVHMDEPAPPAELLAQAHECPPEQTMPRMMLLHFERF